MFAYENFTTHICGQEAPQKLYQRIVNSIYRFVPHSLKKAFRKGAKAKVLKWSASSQNPPPLWEIFFEWGAAGISGRSGGTNFGCWARGIFSSSPKRRRNSEIPSSNSPWTEGTRRARRRRSSAGEGGDEGGHILSGVLLMAGAEEGKLGARSLGLADLEWETKVKRERDQKKEAPLPYPRIDPTSTSSPLKIAGLFPCLCCRTLKTV